MSAPPDALRLAADASDTEVRRAADRLAYGEGAVRLDDRLVLQSTGHGLRCEVLDPMPGAHRCAHEYEVLVENARLALERSPLGARLPSLPHTWVIVDEDGREVWPVS